MKILKLLIVAAAFTGLSAPVVASADNEVKTNQSIWLAGGINNWRAVSRDELIVWSTPSRPTWPISTSSRRLR